MSQEQYEEMQCKVTKLTQELEDVEARVEARITQRFEAMIGTLQAQLQWLAEECPTQKETSPETDNEGQN